MIAGTRENFDRFCFTALAISYCYLFLKNSLPRPNKPKTRCKTIQIFTVHVIEKCFGTLEFSLCFLADSDERNA